MSDLNEEGIFRVTFSTPTQPSLREMRVRFTIYIEFTGPPKEGNGLSTT